MLCLYWKGISKAVIVQIQSTFSRLQNALVSKTVVLCRCAHSSSNNSSVESHAWEVDISLFVFPTTDIAARLQGRLDKCPTQAFIPNSLNSHEAWAVDSLHQRQHLEVTGPERPYARLLPARGT